MKATDKREPIHAEKQQSNTHTHIYIERHREKRLPALEKLYTINKCYFLQISTTYRIRIDSMNEWI